MNRSLLQSQYDLKFIKHVKISWTRFGPGSDTESVGSMGSDLGHENETRGSGSGSCP